MGCRLYPINSYWDAFKGIRGVAAVYNRYDYADEKRAALTEWTAFLNKITAERQRHD